MIQGIIQAVTAKRREGVDAGGHEGRHTRRRAGNAWVKAHRRFNRRAIALGIPVADHPEGCLEPVAQLGAHRAFDLDPALATVSRRHDAREQERVGIWRDIVLKRRGTFEIDRFVGPVAILPDHGGGDSYSSASAVLAKSLDLHFPVRLGSNQTLGSSDCAVQHTMRTRSSPTIRNRFDIRILLPVELVRSEAVVVAVVSRKPRRWCEATRELNQCDSAASPFSIQPKTRAERAFHLGGAGAPAHAPCGNRPIFNFFTAPPLGKGDCREAVRESN